MTQKQFIFSLFVGGLFVAFGAALFTQADIGIGLLGVGVAIAVLAIITRGSKRDTGDAVFVLIPAGQVQHQNSVDS